jgi:hypothetical protein
LSTDFGFSPTTGNLGDLTQTAPGHLNQMGKEYESTEGKKRSVKEKGRAF